jgi:hypothetical protein
MRLWQKGKETLVVNVWFGMAIFIKCDTRATKTQERERDSLFPQLSHITILYPPHEQKKKFHGHFYLFGE